jgi:predicted DNA-binding protein (MmcQ/YjbR family)
MTKEQIQQYLINKPFVVESYPFGENVAVFKVRHKMFATLAIGKMGKGADGKQDWWMNLKCEPQEAIMLRDIFPSIIPGYHMNKVHWNTVILDGSIPQGEIERMIDNSFNLVVSKMTRKDQNSILLHI